MFVGNARIWLLQASMEQHISNLMIDYRGRMWKGTVPQLIILLKSIECKKIV